MTQSERVLKASRSYWGVCQADFISNYTPDGGPIITRVPARIQDLEAAGYVFEIIGWRSKTKIFRLVDEPGTTQSTDAQSDVDQKPPVLFETTPRGRSFANQENAA